MTIKLPKALRGFAYDRVVPIDLNSFDIDLLLPSIFFRVVSEGQMWGRHTNDPTEIARYVQKLAEHEQVSGFDNAAGRRVLDRLVRTSLAQIGRKGTSRTVEQIEGVSSYTFLAFKPEFPAEHSRMRRVDGLIYRMLRAQFRSDGALRAFFEETYGKGVHVKGGAYPGGTYDGHTDLDTMTRLSIALLDGFDPTGVRKAKERPTREACPALAEFIARDLRRYLEAYRGSMEIEALTYHLKALIGFELFVYTLKLFHAVPELVEDCDRLPPAMRRTLESSPPDLYLDFTASTSGLSRAMAVAGVRRDLEAVPRFIAAGLTLRQLDAYAHRLKGNRRVAQIVDKALAEDEGGPEYLQALLRLLDEPAVSGSIDASARHDEDQIRQENAPDGSGEGDLGENAEEIDRLAAFAESDFERLVTILAEAQRTKIGQNIVAWYWSIGGLTKTHGILTGSTKSRQSWRYAPSNDLLATLVQLAAVDIPKWDKDDPRPQPIRLRDFLGWLEERFGILVDRPPAGFAGAEYAAAAQENLQAMLRRLRQMGVFRDLSDDFTVQRLVPPYAGERERETA